MRVVWMARMRLVGKRRKRVRIWTMFAKDMDAIALEIIERVEVVARLRNAQSMNVSKRVDVV